MASEPSKSFKTSPMWGQSNEYMLSSAIPQLPNLQLDSTELNKLLETTVSSEEKAVCLGMFKFLFIDKSFKCDHFMCYSMV